MMCSNNINRCYILIFVKFIFKSISIGANVFEEVIEFMDTYGDQFTSCNCIFVSIRLGSKNDIPKGHFKITFFLRSSM